MFNNTINNISLRYKIYLIPILTFFVLVSMKGFDIYLYNRTESLELNSELGVEIAFRLTQELLLEQQFLINQDAKIHNRIKSNDTQIQQLFSEYQLSEENNALTIKLHETETLFKTHLNVFNSALETVQEINHTKSKISELYRNNDKEIETLSEAISIEASMLMYAGEKLSPVKRELMHSLKEFKGFSSIAMLNINDLLSFSNEPLFLNAEKNLKLKMALVIRACESLSSVANAPKYRTKWVNIWKNQKTIDVLRIRLQKLWKIRQQQMSELEITAQSIQNKITVIVKISKQEVLLIENRVRQFEDYFIILVLLLFMWGSFTLINSILPPMIAITSIMDKLSKGVPNTEALDNIKRKDEIGQLQLSIQWMLKNMLSIENMAKELADGNYDVSIELRSSDDYLGLALKGMTDSLKTYKQTIEAHTEDLEKQVSERTSTLNIMVQELKQTIVEREIAETKLREKTIELENSNQDLEQFAYVASHDLQEPLRMVASYVQLLERRYKDKLDDDAKDFIFFAVDGAKRMQKLINDLLRYSRVSTRGRAKENVNLNEIINDVVNSLKLQIDDTNADIDYEVLPEIMADQAQIFQLLQNLISNAIKFCPDRKPVIKIIAKQIDNFWEITVKDNGIGISDEYYDKIFVIFQRLNDKGSFPGTGIGLALCKKIVEKHGGEIRLDSQKDIGTTFHFTLPINMEKA